MRIDGEPVAHVEPYDRPRRPCKNFARHSFLCLDAARIASSNGIWALLLLAQLNKTNDKRVL